MDQLKKWVTLSVAASVLILAAGWFLAVSPKRSEAADIRDQAAQQISSNATLETQLQMLRTQAKDLPKEQAKLAAVAAKIPSDPALPSLVRALIEAADASGVELVSVAPGTPELVAVAAPAPPPAPADGQAAPADPAATPADPAAAAAGPAGQLANISVAINVVGDYFEVQQFVSALESLPRALRVQDLAITPGASPTEKGETSTEDGRSLTTQVTGFVFMAANRPAATAATVPGDAAPAPAPAADAAAATAAPAE
jgi:Tfp pilus assembly protein PilO